LSTAWIPKFVVLKTRVNCFFRTPKR
jgi:hypothetical protein